VTLEGRDIVCVGFSDWDAAVQTTQHHLIRRAAQRNRVLFVESLGLRRPQVSGGDARRMARRLRRGISPLRAVDGLHVLSPLVLPLHGSRAARRLNAAILPRAVGTAVSRLGMGSPLLWSFVPQAEVLVPSLSPAQILYYITDDHASKPGIDADSFRAAELRFARSADGVFASAPELVRRMQELNANVHYAPAVTDTRLFARALEPGPVDPGLARLPEPRAVYVGAILAATVDVELVAEVAALCPEWSFAFVGPVGQGDPHTNIDVLRQAPNVHLLGERSQQELPDVLRGAAAAIIPYRTGNQMRSVFPMKTYEYLAAGRPVVSTPLETLSAVSDVVTATGAQEFAAGLQDALGADSPEAREARSRRAEPHSWESRLEEIATVIADA
jgi:glycosyltransferase involved in cell wall biosynthesis